MDACAGVPPAGGTNDVSRKRKRGLSRVNLSKMQEGRRIAYKKIEDRKKRLAAASRESTATRAKSRSDLRAITKLEDHIPPQHERCTDITATISQDVLRIVRVVFRLVGDDPRWLHRAATEASIETGVSERMVYNIWHHFEETSTLYVTPRADTKIPKESSEEDDAARSFLEFQIQSNAVKGSTMTMRKLRSKLQAEFKRNFTIYRVEHLLRDLGCKFGRCVVDWTLGLHSERRQRQLLIHLLMMNQMMIDVAAGTAIVFWTDQTFIDLLEHSRLGWMIPGRTHFLFPKGTGTRIGHMHAISAYGLLALTDNHYTPITPPESDKIRGSRAAVPADTAELTFVIDRSKKATGVNKEAKPGFDAQVCADWVKNRFLHTVRKIWPEKKVYLYCDNFAGHSGRAKGVYWPSSGPGQTREVILKNLQKHGCSDLAYEGTVFTVDQLLALPPKSKAPQDAPQYPPVKHIIAEGRRFMLAKDPLCAYSAMQRAAHADGNCTIIYAVPLTPDSNFIEELWSTQKGDLAREYDGPQPADVIMERWRRSTYDRRLNMQGARQGATIVGSDMETNSHCVRYQQHVLQWAQNNLVPHSALAHCGKLGEFDLSMCPGALELSNQLRESDLAYYNIWKKTEDLSLALSEGVDAPLDSDTDDEAVDSESDGDD